MTKFIGAVAAGVLCLALWAPGASAGQSPLTITDRAGDGIGPGDIRGLRVDQAGGDLIFQIRTQRPLNLAAAPAWNGESAASQVRFAVDTDDDAAAEAIVRLTASPEGPDGSVQRLGGMAAPQGTLCVLGYTQPQPTIVRIRVGLSCFESFPLSVQTIGRYRFDQGGDGTIDSNDRAPDAGWTQEFFTVT